jgi:hypothetical protein
MPRAAVVLPFPFPVNTTTRPLLIGMCELWLIIEDKNQSKFLRLGEVGNHEKYIPQNMNPIQRLMAGANNNAELNHLERI